MYFTHPQFKKLPLGLFFKKSSEANFKNKLADFFPNYNFIFTDSGRSAFQAAIKELELKNSEMILPAYICDIFRPILKHFGIKPVYIDTDIETFQADFSDIETLITQNTKSILICHTYGLPIEMDKIIRIAKNYNLKIIEDCAHIWPSKIGGDCAFFSFTKLFPVINGGMLISKDQINTNLEKHEPKPTNPIKILRLLPFFANLSERFRPEERLTERKWAIPRKISKLSLKTVNHCIDSLKEQIEKRIVLAKYFQDKLINLGFKVQNGPDNTFTYLSALVPENIDRNSLFKKLRKHKVFCSRIWQNPLFKQLPNTSIISEKIINLPLQDWFKPEDIDVITQYLKEIISENKPV
jgi:perosamine synthetase